MQHNTSEVVDNLNKTNNEADKMLQKVIQWVKSKEASKVSRLPAWREKFNSFSIDSPNYLYMEERLATPAYLRASIISQNIIDTPIEIPCSAMSPKFGGPKYTERWLRRENVAIRATQQVKTINLY